MNQPNPTSIERWAIERPDEVAVVEGESSVTWAELDDLANRVANALKVRGVGEGDIVAMRTRPRLEWAVIAGAIAKLGCAMLGLNFRLTADESRHVITDSGATVLVCDDEDPAAFVSSFTGSALRIAVSIETPAAGLVSYTDLLQGSPDKRYAKGDPRLIIYTSGTTGRPKGVVMNQDAGVDAQTLREFHQGREGYVRCSDRDATLINMPFHHAAGPAQFWASVHHHNKIVLQRRFNPEETLQLIAKHRISHWTAVPTMFKRIHALPAATLEQADVSSIGQIRIGTAPVPLELKHWILDYFGEVLHEVYGASEVGLVSLLLPEMQRTRPASSGRLLPHVQLQVRDADGNALPAGQTGELWVKTPVVIRSYLNAPPLDPDTLDATGFFRTGDVGYMDDEGYLFITDRVKDMIISGGVNIYPAEIEAALQKHPAVLDAAVIGIPDDEFGEQVHAFCELKPGQRTDEATLLAHCVPLLASYKRPRRVEFMEELPRNPMGKLLKRDLREPYWKNKERQV